MGTLSFEYLPEPRSTVSAKFFEFKRDTTTEYSLDYERYAALSDASIFNAPVAIIKVATGVCLYDLFDSRVACSPNKKEHDVALFKGQSFVKMREPMEILSDQTLIDKKPRPVNEFIRKRLNRPVRNVNISQSSDIFTYNDCKYRHNILEQIFVNRPTPQVRDYEFSVIQKPVDSRIKFYKSIIDNSFKIDYIVGFFEGYFVDKLFGSNIVYYKEVFANIHNYIDVIFYTQEAIPKSENTTIFYSNDILPDPSNETTIIYSHDRILDSENIVEWYSQEIIPKPNITVNAPQDYFIEIDTNCTNAINTVLNILNRTNKDNDGILRNFSDIFQGDVIRPDAKYNVYQTFPIRKSDDINVQCFKEYFAWIYDYRVAQIIEMLNAYTESPYGFTTENISVSSANPVTGQFFEQISLWRKYKESLLGEQTTTFKDISNVSIYSPKDDLLFRYPEILNHLDIWPIFGKKENKRSNPLNIYPIINTHINIKEIITDIFINGAKIDISRMSIFEDINVFKYKKNIIYTPFDAFLQRPEYNMGIVLQEPIMASHEDKKISQNEIFYVLKQVGSVYILALGNFATHEEKHMNHTESILTSGDTKSIIEDNSLEEAIGDNASMNILGETNLATHNDKVVHTGNIEFFKDAKSDISSFALEFGADKGKNIIQDDRLHFGKDYNKNIGIDEHLHFGKGCNNNIYIDTRVQVSKEVDQNFAIQDIAPASDTGRILFNNVENIIIGKKDRNPAFVLENVHGYKDKIHFIITENIFGKKDKENALIFEDEFTSSNQKLIYVLPQDYDITQDRKSAYCINSISGIKEKIGVFLQAQSIEYAFKDKKKISLYYQAVSNPERITNINTSGIENTDYWAYKSPYEMWLDRELINVILKRKKLHELEFGKLILKSKKPFSIVYQQMIYPEKKPLMQLERDEFLSFDISEIGPSVTDRDFSIFEEAFMAFKTPYSIPWPNGDFTSAKTNKELSIQDTSSSIYKESKKLNIDIVILWTLWKTQYEMSILKTIGNIDKESHKMYLDNSQHFLEKTDDSKSLSIQDSLVGAIKTKYPLSVGYFVRDPYWSNYDGFIVALSKVRCNVTINAINDFAKKFYHSAMISEQSFASVLAKPAGLDSILELDQIPKDAFIDYENDMIVRSKLKSDMNEGGWTFKTNHYVNVQYYVPWAEVHYRPVHIDNLDTVSGGDKKQFDTNLIASDIFGETPLKEIFETSQTQASKHFVNTSVFDELDSEAIKKEMHVHLFKDEWLKMFPDHLDYYTYDEIGAIQDHFACIEEQEPIIKTDGYGMLNFVDPVVRNDQYAWIEQGIFDIKLIKQAQLTYQLDWANRVMKKCDLHPDDFGNWAWVYETPDPFKFDKFGIDELLLPEKDTHYEHFEDMIFNKKIMRPINPIKNISDTEWIAALPIRHPVSKHSDVGRIYDASAVKWENYFGIHSSVIHDMSLKYYRIWEKHMYQFSTMTMQQSANQMLEYLWAWIPLYFPLELLEQAYRAFQLVRWYTESAIINNSHYRISFEYCDLKWPEGKDPGICTIPNDLKEYDPVSNYNDTMYSNLDPKALCLMANPIYCGSNPIWVEFSIDNKRNTTITFNLHNPIGYVNILLNGQVIDTITGIGTHRLVYNIRYTGLVNTFRIEKPVTSLLDKNFIIGNITVVMQSFKNLHIEFDPETRNGNKPLNEVAQKLIAFANLHDRKDVAYHEILSKNLAISEVYKSLVKYWERHHEGKSKGKRLTIKQV